MKEDNCRIKQVFCFGDIVLLAVLLTLGLIFMFIGRDLLGPGIAIIACWACMIPFWKHGYRIEGQPGLFRMKEIVASRNAKDDILAYLEGRIDSLEYNSGLGGGAIVEVYTGQGGIILARYWNYADARAGINYGLNSISPEQKARLEQIEPKS